VNTRSYIELKWIVVESKLREDVGVNGFTDIGCYNFNVFCLRSLVIHITGRHLRDVGELLRRVVLSYPRME
jgi:hypothetical protein